MQCKNCGKDFVPLSVVQIYCCEKCGREFRKKNDMNKYYPSITFPCAKCGKIVVTEGGTRDKRTRFCSKVCEKKYWRHPPWEKETSRTNFHSVQEYLSWERRTNL